MSDSLVYRLYEVIGNTLEYIEGRMRNSEERMAELQPKTSEYFYYEDQYILLDDIKDVIEYDMSRLEFELADGRDPIGYVEYGEVDHNPLAIDWDELDCGDPTCELCYMPMED